MTRVYSFILLTILAVSGMSVRASAAWSEVFPTDPSSGIGIKVESPIDASPPEGTLPCWVTIKNRSGAAHTWGIECMSQRRYGDGINNASSQALRVESGETGRLLVLMPLDTSMRGTYYGRENRIRINGFGIADGTVDVPTERYTGYPQTAFVGMGDSLGGPIWAALTKEFSGKSQALAGSLVDVSLLSGDWRSLTGFDCLWLTEEAYAGLDAPRRTAIRHWIDMGGRFYVCAAALNPSLRAGLGLPETGDEGHPGFGLVRVIPWDGKDFPVDKARQLISEIPAAHDGDNSYGDAAYWQLAKSVGVIPVNAPFLIAFIGLFAALVGPVNLFWLAKGSRRHRLFWTTPIISVVASLLLVGVILLQDGFGGQGERMMVTLLLPDQRKAVVWQEQVARTGVLTSRQFSVSQELLLTPIKIARFSGKSYNQAGQNYGGDWFSSREVQAHRLQAIVPSRAEIQLLNADAAKTGAAPKLSSSIPATLKEIRYLDAEKRRWRGGSLRTGEQIVLQPDADPTPLAELNGSRAAGGNAAQFWDRPGCFYALADDGPFFDTLSSIRWRKQQAVFIGPVTGAR